ncbi:MAG: DEAD/DEAH box helicase [Anaerolineae bacterium]|nr:DEAD/DEAH box helicase [Anaerolineae bacterium]
MIFKDLDLHPRVLAGLGASGNESLTPVQEQALPPILEGRDVLVIAPRTDGERLAFVLPILQHTLFGSRGRIQAVILTPTQELAQTIIDTIQDLGQHTRVRSLVLCDGPIPPQIATLHDGVEVIVACPARLLEHLNRGSIDLSRAGLLVLEDIDRFCDMGFLPDLWRILKATPTEHQTLLFATTDNEELRKTAQTLLREPITVQIGEVVSVPAITHQFYPVDAEAKTEALLALLDSGEIPSEALLIFCETRFRARRLGEKLKHAGYAIAILTDELSPKRRNIAIEGFRQQTSRIIVTTDVAAQGLDVTSIAHIINFDMPATAEIYLHRSGRTAYSKSSPTAINLVAAEDDEIVAAITLELGERPRYRTLPQNFE